MNLVTRFARIDPLEAFLASYTALWGAFLLLPADTFATSASYGVLSSLASEGTLGLVVTGVGLVQLLSLLRASRGLRAVGALAAALLWLFLALAVGIASGWGAVGIVHFALVAAANGFVYLRVGRRHGE